MIHKLSMAIAGRLTDGKEVNEETAEVIAYGYEVLIDDVFMMISLLLLGILIHSFAETLTFIITFCSLRKLTGGYHANTRCKCAITTLICWAVIVGACRLNSSNNLVILILCILGLGIVILFSPCKNEKKPLSAKREREFKFKATILYVIMFIFAFYVQKDLEPISLSIFCTEITVALSILVSKIGRIRDEGYRIS